MWTLDYSGSKTAPAVTEVGTGTITNANECYVYDIFICNSNTYVILTDTIFKTEIWDVDTAPFSEVDDVSSGDNEGLELSFAVVVGTDAYFLHYYWNATNVAYFPYIIKFTGTTTTLSYQSGAGLAGYKVPIRNLQGIAYDGSDVFYFVIKKHSDSKNYLMSYSITDDSFTVLGEQNISLMLDRNTEAGVMEKAFHITEYKVYQLHPYALYQLYFISSVPSDAVIIIITDNFLVNDDLDVFEYIDVSSKMTRVEFVHEIQKASFGSLGINRDILTIEKGMFVQLLGNYTSEPDAFIYPATYNFEDDEVGDFPDGWIDSDGANCETTIIASLDGHKKVMQLNDQGGATRCQAIIYAFTQGLNTTIEFWLTKDSVAADTVFMFDIYDDNDRLISLRWEDNDLDYWNGGWVSIKDDFLVANVFSHFRIVLDDTANTFDCYIDGVLEGSDLAYENNSTSGADNLLIETDNFDTGYKCYIDAIGISADPNYVVGDNTYWQYYQEGEHSFEDEAVGSEPAGWVSDNDAGCSTNVIASFNGHKKVLQLYDFSAVGRAFIKNTFSVQPSGTVELFFRSDDVTDELQIQLVPSGEASLGVQIQIESDKIQYFHTGAWHDATGGGVSDNIHYHAKIVFDCTPDTYSFYLNGVLLDANIPFRDAQPSLAVLRLLTDDANTGYRYYIDAIGYSWDANYTVGDNLLLSNGITQGIEDSVIFEGIVVDFNGERLQKVWLESPAKKELENVKPRGDFSGRSDEIMVSLVSTYCKYVTIGTLSEGTAMGTITYAGDKTLQTVFNELALFEKWILKLGPQGRLYFNDGTTDSEVRIRVDARKTDKVWRVKSGEVREPYNYFYLKGAIVNGVQLYKELEEADDLVSQQQFGFNPFEKTYASFNAQGILDQLTANVKAKLKETPLVIEHWHYDAELGMLAIGEVVTFKYDTTNVNVVSDQFLINRVLFKAEQNAGGYTIADKIV